MKFFFSWFVLSFIIGCSNSKIIKIEEPILPKTYDEIMVPQERYLSNSQNKNRKLRSGLVEFQGNEKFKLCFEDANLNGSFFDFGIDKVGLAFEADSFVLISQMLNPKIYFSAGNLLKNDQVFSVNKQPYKIVKFDNASSSVKVRKLKQNNKEFDFLLDRQFPDFSYRIENQVYGQILDDLDKTKKYHLVIFWSPLCPPCIEEFPELKMLSEYSVELILICGMCDDEQQSLKILKEFEMPGIHIFSNGYIEKVFNQNGFPFRVLFDKDLNYIDRFFTTEDVVNFIVK